MIRTENHLGHIDISHEYFADLITATATACFGVAGMAFSSNKQSLKNKLLKKDIPNKGIKVWYNKQNLSIDLHIMVSYGMNISAVVKSIVNKVRYAVEHATGITVANVNVFVDEIKM